MSGIDAAGLVAALQRAGFAAETRAESGGVLVFAKGPTTPFQATLTNCTAGRCTDVELFAAFEGKQIAWERINGWNARTRFARAFLDERRTPSLQMDLSLEGGVTTSGLETSLKTWGASVETFALFLTRPATVGAAPGVAAPGVGVAAPGVRVPPADPAPLTLPPAGSSRK